MDLNRSIPFFMGQSIAGFSTPGLTRRPEILPKFPINDLTFFEIFSGLDPGSALEFHSYLSGMAN